jgi:hypothetical protein
MQENMQTQARSMFTGFPFVATASAPAPAAATPAGQSAANPVAPTGAPLPDKK